LVLLPKTKRPRDTTTTEGSNREEKEEDNGGNCKAFKNENVQGKSEKYSN